MSTAPADPTVAIPTHRVEPSTAEVERAAQLAHLSRYYNGENPERCGFWGGSYRSHVNAVARRTGRVISISIAPETRKLTRSEAARIEAAEERRMNLTRHRALAQAVGRLGEAKRRSAERGEPVPEWETHGATVAQYQRHLRSATRATARRLAATPCLAVQCQQGRSRAPRSAAQRARGSRRGSGSASRAGPSDEPGPPAPSGVALRRRSRWGASSAALPLPTGRAK